MAAGVVAADLQELHAGMGQQVGHTQEWQGTSVILAAMGNGRPYLRAIADENRIPRTRSSRSLGLRVQAERQGLDRQRSFPDRLLDARLAGRILLRTEDVRQRPARNDPGEAFLRRQLPLLIDDPQRAVHHLHAVLAENAFDRVGVTDVEMRLEGDPHVGDLGRRRDIRLGWSGDGLDLPGRIGLSPVRF